MRRASMARFAGDLLAPVKSFLVDHGRHRHHFARGLLGAFIVGREIALHVAERAIHAERSRDELHRRLELVGGRALQLHDVLVDFLGRLAIGRLGKAGMLRIAQANSVVAMKPVNLPMKSLLFLRIVSRPRYFDHGGIIPFMRA